MAYERQNGDIAVFYQNNKTNPKAPDYKGTILWNGEEMEIALWSKRDNGMLTGKMQPKRAKGEYQKPPQNQPEKPVHVNTAVSNFEDDLPW